MNEYQKKRFAYWRYETAAVFVAKHLIAERARLEVYDPQVPASQRYNAAEGVDN
jgi:hypothetical protein